MTDAANKSMYFFFLGGHDLEMVTIRDLLVEFTPNRFHDKGLSWGAKASAYKQEIADTLSKDMIPVLVELDNDLGLDYNKVVLIDHHGQRAGSDRPTSLDQVFDLLGLSSSKRSRWHDLVAANDMGYIPAMLKIGATREEIIAIRAADRKPQGITQREEEEGVKAAAKAETFSNGRLTVVRLPHSRTATVTDILDTALGGPGYESLLILSPEEVNFYGKGNLIQLLHNEYPKGWYGGSLPERGFWGHGKPLPDVLPFLLKYFHAG